MYTAFASVYDRLMADVDYLAWARFYHELMERYGVPRGKVCECACGTGSITIALSKMGYQMTGVDLSPDMLFEASQKARRHRRDDSFRQAGHAPAASAPVHGTPYYAPMTA